MSLFFVGDVVIFEQDRAITGVIDLTWSDFQTEPTYEDDDVYIHTSTPASVRKVWCDRLKISPSYVIVQFLLPQDGFCLVAERFVRLRDRPLMVGEVVKRKPSDVQSGRVLSFSTDCTLSPVSLMNAFGSTNPTVAQDHQTNQRQLLTRPTSEMARINGLAYSDQEIRLTSLDESRLLTIPAAEVKHYLDYLEYDYLIYKEWIGRVVGVLDEVTMRLHNGSEVVVEKTDELRVPSSSRGTRSWDLIQRLNRAGYRRDFKESGLPSQNYRNLPDLFCPGQHVRTTKGNLRRGKWMTGAYDANIDPQGIVSNVRTAELEVEWLAPNFLNTDHGQAPTPPCILGTDVLQCGGIKKIRNGRLPLQPLAKTLAAATTSDDILFGAQVQLRDPIVPTVPYALGDRVVPETQLRKHDTNAWHVISTCTKVMVQWQDGSLSEEASVSVIPKTDMDVNDMWPGDKVSLRADETTTSTPVSGAPALEENGRTRSDHTVLQAHTMGVVQSVNAVERLAKVRWFQDADFRLDTDEHNHSFRALPSSTYGCMTENLSEVSLYDISVHTAFYPKLGDLAVACPTVPSPYMQLENCFGKVVELCLNGEVIVRCSAASQPHDVRVSISNLTMIATMDLEGEDENDDSVSRAEEDVQRRNGSYNDSPEPIAVLVEYEGGENMDLDDDEGAWGTDDSMTSATESTYEDANEKLDEVSEHLLAQAAAPSPFMVLDDDLPIDQYFSGELQTACADTGRKAIKEHKIMRSSLPDGVFVRTWESRLDLFRILIVGPVGTPYEYAPFLFDLQLAATFPDVPPKVFFHSWTNSLGRINPNLYEDGKVCLSLLGTWPADEKNEGWSKKSTVLQILVSIMGLILVREPYYNEAGFEVLIGSEEASVSSRMYSETAFVMAKGFVKEALLNPPGGLSDVVEWLYRAHPGPRLLDRVVSSCEAVSPRPLAASQADFPYGKHECSSHHLALEGNWASSTARLSAGALIPLHRYLDWLAEHAKEGTQGNSSTAVAGASHDGKANGITRDEN